MGKSGTLPIFPFFSFFLSAKQAGKMKSASFSVLFGVTSFATKISSSTLFPGSVCQACSPSLAHEPD